MTPAEAAEDLEQIFASVRTLYGPYEYKEARFGYSIAALEEEARNMLSATPSDDGFYTAALWFLTRLEDGHVQLQLAPNSNPVVAYRIGIYLQPVEGKALIAEILDPSLAGLGIAYGDEVVAVDGVSPFALLSEHLKLETLANDVSNQHLISRTFMRSGIASSLRPVSPTAHVELRRADGSEYSRNLIWSQALEERASLITPPDPTEPVQKDAFLARSAVELSRAARSSLARIGSPQPFFLTPPTQAVFNITEVTANEGMMARYGLNPEARPDVYAALYSYAGKSILLVRQSTYNVPDEVERLQYFRALMDQYDDFVDGLVVDQTHNPGGSGSYCVGFARLFASEPGNGFVQAMNTDRRWINALRAAASGIDPTFSTETSRSFELRASLIEAAYDAGLGITAPMPFFESELLPDDSYVWTKPRLVLIDELAGSCGDVFPMLVKQNHLAPLFGRRTMGLGGSVEAFGPLTNSNAQFTLTRGLFTVHREDGAYTQHDFVENSGVQPDIEHEITVGDFRTGFVDYMAHFSDQIVSQIEAQATGTDTLME